MYISSFTTRSLLLTLLFPTAACDCCFPNIYRKCKDCSTAHPCCGQKNCNMFCCNCTCLKADPCKLRCSFQTSLQPRTIEKQELSPFITEFKNVTDIMKMLDNNQDGRIDKLEMILWFSKKNNVNVKYIIDQFNSMDLNGDSFLSPEEIDLPINPRSTRSVDNEPEDLQLPTNNSQVMHNRQRLIGVLDVVTVISTLLQLISKGSSLWTTIQKHDQGAKHVTLRLVKAPQEMCGIEVEIASLNTSITQYVPALDKYTCGKSFEIFESRFFSSGTIYEEELNFTRYDEIRNIKLRVTGHTPLLLKNLCFVLDRFVATSADGGIVCLDNNFFLSCASMKLKNSDQFKKAADENYIKLSKSPGQFNVLEIKEVQEFMSISLSIDKKESAGDDAEKLFEKLCNLVNLYSEKDKCSGSTKGCSCKNGLLLPDGCKVYNRGSIIESVVSEMPVIKKYLAVFEDLFTVNCES